MTKSLSHIFPYPTLEETLEGLKARREFLKSKVGAIKKQVNRDDHEWTHTS